MLKIKNIAEYIQIVSKLTLNANNYVYRGENKIYTTSCVPNIFRERRRVSNFSFERNILNKIRSEGLDGNQSYLLTAIEAQHGGFPSRLLDISYNSLIALHFAVTPFYNRNENAEDSEDGQVIIIKVEDMLSPSSNELENLYEGELLNNTSVKNCVMLLAHQHKMVDFYSKNQRIKAQQGGFIIFFGNEYRPLPEYLLQRVIIPAEAKSKIRYELDRLFNISNAYVYPESNNLVNRIVKSTDSYANFDKFDNTSEINKVIRNFNRNLRHHIIETLKLRDQNDAHLNALKQMIQEKESTEIKNYCDLHQIDYSHIPTKKNSGDLYLKPQDATLNNSEFEKIVNKRLVNKVVDIECYIYDFYLDIMQSREFMRVNQESDKELSEEYFSGLMDDFEFMVNKAINDINIILSKTEIAMTPYNKLIN